MTNIHYAHQLVEKEHSCMDDGIIGNSVYLIKHKPIANDTLTGSIYRKQISEGIEEYIEIQTFCVFEGKFKGFDMGHLPIKATSGSLNNETGELKLNWNSPPGENYLVFNYEYDPYFEELEKVAFPIDHHKKSNFSKLLESFNEFKTSVMYDYGSPGIAMFPEEKFNDLVNQLELFEKEESERKAIIAQSYKEFVENNGQWP